MNPAAPPGQRPDRRRRPRHVHCGRTARRAAGARLPTAGPRHVPGPVGAPVTRLCRAAEGPRRQAHPVPAGRRAAGAGQPRRRRWPQAARVLRWDAPPRRHRPGPAQRPGVARRRRADRRPRPRGAHPLPHPALPARRAPDRGAVHPHRRGRRADLHRAGSPRPWPADLPRRGQRPHGAGERDRVVGGHQRPAAGDRHRGGSPPAGRRYPLPDRRANRARRGRGTVTPTLEDGYVALAQQHRDPPPGAATLGYPAGG